jgi:hypothetical protein
MIRLYRVGNVQENGLLHLHDFLKARYLLQDTAFHQLMTFSATGLRCSVATAARCDALRLTSRRSSTAERPRPAMSERLGAKVKFDRTLGDVEPSVAVSRGWHGPIARSVSRPDRHRGTSARNRVAAGPRRYGFADVACVVTAVQEGASQ